MFGRRKQTPASTSSASAPTASNTPSLSSTSSTSAISSAVPPPPTGKSADAAKSQGGASFVSPMSGLYGGSATSTAFRSTAPTAQQPISSMSAPAYSLSMHPPNQLLGAVPLKPPLLLHMQVRDPSIPISFQLQDLSSDFEDFERQRKMNLDAQQHVPPFTGYSDQVSQFKESRYGDPAPLSHQLPPSQSIHQLHQRQQREQLYAATSSAPSQDSAPPPAATRYRTLPVYYQAEGDDAGHVSYSHQLLLQQQQQQQQQQHHHQQLQQRLHPQAGAVSQSDPWPR